MWISEGRRHEHRERHREKYVGPSNPACMFSGCNLTAEGCVCESQSCHHHFAYINRSQCHKAAGKLEMTCNWNQQPHISRPVTVALSLKRAVGIYKKENRISGNYKVTFTFQHLLNLNMNIGWLQLLKCGPSHVQIPSVWCTESLCSSCVCVKGSIDPYDFKMTLVTFIVDVEQEWYQGKPRRKEEGGCRTKNKGEKVIGPETENTECWTGSETRLSFSLT